jgi:hypothetical protein
VRFQRPKQAYKLQKRNAKRTGQIARVNEVNFLAEKAGKISLKDSKDFA